MSNGLYIHIPFCIRKCHYCDFISFPAGAAQIGQYLHALQGEMALVSAHMTPEEKNLTSIFLGGGTPTCLNSCQLGNIMANIREYFTWPAGIEVTVEANPGTLTLDKLKQLRQQGVNRLSIGIQAFQDDLLAKLGRIHRKEDISKGVTMAREAGFANLNLDLIYGIPGQTMDQWQDSLARAVDLGLEHLAAYSLKIEEGTPYHEAYKKGNLTPCEEELELEMYLYTIEFLKSQGFHHYEISNFALPGKESRHNLIYWLNHTYLGLGPGAHSSWRNRRTANPGTLEEYVTNISTGVFPAQVEEIITPEIAMAETMFLGLRLTEGVDLEAFVQRFGVRAEDVYGEAINNFVDKGLLTLKEGRLHLTRQGLPLANLVFQAFV
ncbi:MAG: radical SAM family heme chaperone HemW [Clostridia bacterium]|nr:radical SAM family heme chaperone HemW [Clostridia bacterium]